MREKERDWTAVQNPLLPVASQDPLYITLSLYIYLTSRHLSLFLSLSLSRVNLSRILHCIIYIYTYCLLCFLCSQQWFWADGAVLCLTFSPCGSCVLVGGRVPILYSVDRPNFDQHREINQKRYFLEHPESDPALLALHPNVIILFIFYLFFPPLSLCIIISLLFISYMIYGIWYMVYVYVQGVLPTVKKTIPKGVYGGHGDVDEDPLSVEQQARHSLDHQLYRFTGLSLTYTHTHTLSLW